MKGKKLWKRLFHLFRCLWQYLNVLYLICWKFRMMMGNRQSCKTLRESVQYSVILLGHKWKRNWDDDGNDQKDKGNVEILISGSQAFKQRWWKNWSSGFDGCPCFHSIFYHAWLYIWIDFQRDDLKLPMQMTQLCELSQKPGEIDSFICSSYWQHLQWKSTRTSYKI